MLGTSTEFDPELILSAVTFLSSSKRSSMKAVRVSSDERRQHGEVLFGQMERVALKHTLHVCKIDSR